MQLLEMVISKLLPPLRESLRCSWYSSTFGRPLSMTTSLWIGLPPNHLIFNVSRIVSKALDLVVTLC